MGLFLPGRTRKPRRFDYEPRYYRPEKDKDERIKQRLRIQSKVRRRNPAGLVYFLILLAFVLYVLYAL